MGEIESLELMAAVIVVVVVVVVVKRRGVRRKEWWYGCGGKDIEGENRCEKVEIAIELERG